MVVFREYSLSSHALHILLFKLGMHRIAWVYPLINTYKSIVKSIKFQLLDFYQNKPKIFFGWSTQRNAEKCYVKLVDICIFFQVTTKCEEKKIMKTLFKNSRNLRTWSMSQIFSSSTIRHSNMTSNSTTFLVEDSIVNQ